MPEYTTVSVTDAGAIALLTAYFSDRESSFPSAQGGYRTSFPAAEDFIAPRGVFLLVSEDSTGGEAAFVGCGGVRRVDDAPDGRTRYEVKHLWLHPRVRGKGWGRDLLRELEQRAVDFGADELVLDTNSSLEAAGALYKSAGFAEVEPYNDNPNATNWFRKQLAN